MSSRFARGLVGLALLAGLVTLPARAPAVQDGPPNLALAGTATVSGIEQGLNDRFNPRFLNDGDLSTRWSSEYSDTAWAQIELATASPVDHVTLAWEPACASTYKVQVSVDGSTWTDKASVTSTCATDTVQVGQTEPVKFVRMQGQTRRTQWGYSIWEFGVYAEPEPPRPVLTGVQRLIPKPVQASNTGGPAFELGRGSEIVAQGNARAVGEYLAGVLRPETGFDLPVTSGKPQRGDVVLDLGPGKGPAGHTAEGYKLTTERRTATISADTPAGLFNGVQTLRQLFGQWSTVAPAATVTDWPRFGYRGSMLDVARSFLTPAEVKRYIDALVQFKVNTLHLHLADDQAWRIVIDAPADNPSGLDYDALTRIASHGGADVTGSGTPLGTEPAHRGFYTKAEYKSIVAYAASRFVTIVPEIDGPGHVNAALASIAQLNPDGVTKPMNNTGNVGYSTLQAGDPVTYEFLTRVWKQLAELTPGPYLHIGGDEAHVTGHDNYLTYIGKVVPIVNGLGKKTMGWNEYAAQDLPAGSVVQYWAGSIAPVLAQVARGAKVVMSPASTAYLDMKYNPSTPIGLSWACSGDCDWNRYYNWNPVQQGLTETDVLGVEAPLWSETVRGIEQAEFLAFPRMISVAEMGWTPQQSRDVTDFGDRLAAYGGSLTVDGTNFYPSPKAQWTVDATAADRKVRIGEDLAGQVALFTAPAVKDAGSVAVSIEYGDGTAAVPGSVRQPRPASSLRAPGVFEVVGPSHAYTAAGSYQVKVMIGATTVVFTVDVKA